MSASANILFHSPFGANGDYRTEEPQLYAERRKEMLKRTRNILEQFSVGNIARDSQSTLFDVASERSRTAPFVEGKDLIEEEVGNVIRFSAPRIHPERPEISIVAVQEWEGRIESVGEDSFDATLVDVSTDAYRPTDKMQIPIGLVDAEERHLLQPGVIFRLVVGRERYRGSVRNTTLVYLRRNKFKKPIRFSGEKFESLIQGWK